MGIREQVYKVVNEKGTFWYNEKGQFHRENGPAIECVNGDKFWLLNGKLHRKNGPAAEYADGSKFWYISGQFDRRDGPALEYADGTRYWYLNGKKYSEAEFIQIMDKNNLCR